MKIFCLKERFFLLCSQRVGNKSPKYSRERCLVFSEYTIYAKVLFPNLNFQYLFNNMARVHMPFNTLLKKLFSPLNIQLWIRISESSYNMLIFIAHKFKLFKKFSEWVIINNFWSCIIRLKRTIYFEYTLMLKKYIPKLLSFPTDHS